MRYVRILIKVSISVIILLCLTPKLQAQSISAITITPPFVSLKPGESYELTIINETPANYNFRITPMLFEIDTTHSSLKPIEDQVQGAIKAVECITLQSENIIELQAGEKAIIPITFLKWCETGRYPGVLISEQNTDDTSQVSIGSAASSIIIDKTVSPEQLKDIVVDLAIKSDLQFGSVAFTNIFDLETFVYNNSTSIIKPFGSIQIKSGNTVLKTISLSQKLPETLFPLQNGKVDSTFIDGRPFWKRFGFVDYTVMISVDNQEVAISKQVLSIPIEIAVIIIGIFTAIGLLMKSIYRKKLKSVSSSAS